MTDAETIAKQIVKLVYTCSVSSNTEQIRAKQANAIISLVEWTQRDALRSAKEEIEKRGDELCLDWGAGCGPGVIDEMLETMKRK